MNIPNGVKSTTLENIEFEAGLILSSKFAVTDTSADLKAKVLCATTGGIKVAVAPIEQSIKFDGLLENTAGLKRVVGWTGSVQFSTKEVDSSMVKRALGYAGITSDAVNNVDTITLGQGVIPESYYENFYILGKMGDGSWRQIIVNKAMNVGGLNETRNDKGETEIAFDLQANYTIDTQDTPPVSIEYIEEPAPVVENAGGSQV